MAGMSSPKQPESEWLPPYGLPPEVYKELAEAAFGFRDLRSTPSVSAAVLRIAVWAIDRGDMEPIEALARAALALAKATDDAMAKLVDMIARYPAPQIMYVREDLKVKDE